MNTSLDLFARSERETAIETLHSATALYTRDPVVLELLDEIAWPRGGGATIDTSCGDGAFLARAVERLIAAEADITLDALAQRVHGWEIHPLAASDARTRVAHTLAQHGFCPIRATLAAGEMIRCGDFLMEGPAKGLYRAVVGNPPYLRMLNVPQLLRAEYEQVLPAYARADLLHSFIDRCANVLEPDGEFAMVTADRWLFNEGAARLREVVGMRFVLAKVRRLDASSVFYRPKQRRAGTPPRIHPVAVVLQPVGQRGTALGPRPIYPEAKGIESDVQLRLGEVADVRLAPWLGTPGIFLVESHVTASWNQSVCIPAIDTDDITGGQLRTPRRIALLTYPDRTPDTHVMAHLDRELPRMCPRGRGAVRWMPPEPFHRFDLSRPSLVVPRIAKTLKLVRVPAGVLPVNHNLSIINSGAMSLEAIVEALRSDEANDWCCSRAARLENGYFSFTTRLLRDVPIS